MLNYSLMLVLFISVTKASTKSFEIPSDIFQLQFINKNS